MKATDLEIAVLKMMLAHADPPASTAVLDPEAVKVIERAFTGIGVMTSLEQCEGLRLFDKGVALRWGEIGARLNADRLETGYVVYVDDGYVNTIEGYTYGRDWPREVDRFELYELKDGMVLNAPR